MGKIIYGNYIIEKYKEGYRVFLISIDKFVYCDSYREVVNEIHNDCKNFSKWYSTTTNGKTQVFPYLHKQQKMESKPFQKKNVMTKLNMWAEHNKTRDCTTCKRLIINHLLFCFDFADNSKHE